MSAQAKLILLLKQKGTGKTMSKSLTVAQCDELTTYLHDPGCLIATKTTILMAFFMLEHTDDEASWFTKLENTYKECVPKECFFLFDPTIHTPSPILQTCIYKLIRHQHLSYDELGPALSACLENTTPTYMIAAFLEGLRLKEESAEENAFFLTSLWQHAKRSTLEIPLLIDIATAYDGFNRHPNLLLALAVLLASIGFPTIIHGCKDVSPKFGITAHKLLVAANKDPLKPIDSIRQCLQDRSIGWGYCDQSLSFPALHALRECRTEMVKRPVLATVEKFLQPFLSTHQNFLVTGYTHPAYRSKTSLLLDTLSHCDGYVFVRGVEGSPFAPLDRRCPLISKLATKNHEGFSSPDTFGFSKRDDFTPDTGITTAQSLALMKTALQDSRSLVAQWVIYNALMIVSSLKLSASIDTTKQQLIDSIDSGLAFSHWNRY